MPSGSQNFFYSCPSGPATELNEATVNINLHRLDLSFQDDFRCFFLHFLITGGLELSWKGDLNGLICILLIQLGFGGSAQLSEVRWRGTLVLSGSNATPVVLERERDELLIWRSQLSSQKSLSTLLQTAEKCHVRNLLFHSIRACSLLACQSLLWSWDRSFLVQSDRTYHERFREWQL